MDNPGNQPNGILPRPQSRGSSRPPQSHQPPPPTHRPRQQQQMYSSEVGDTMEGDDDDFGFSSVPPPAPPPTRPRVPAATQEEEPKEKKSHKGQISRSSSKDKDKDNLRNVEGPQFLKIAVIGDSTVGKSCLCNAVTSDTYTFTKGYHLTCGVNVYPKSVKIPTDNKEDAPSASSDQDSVIMALLDSSGKDVYSEYLPKYWEKLDGFVLVADLTAPTSLVNCEHWLKLVSKCSPSKGTMMGVLVGNKADLTDRRQINAAKAQEFAEKHELQYFECSVKSNSGMEEPFFYLAHKWSTGAGHDKENFRH